MPFQVIERQRQARSLAASVRKTMPPTHSSQIKLIKRVKHMQVINRKTSPKNKLPYGRMKMVSFEEELMKCSIEVQVRQVRRQRVPDSKEQ